MVIKIQENVPLAPLTTFNIGGSARYFAEIKSEAEITEVFAVAQEKGIPLIMFAGGSNVLVPDEGLNALVVSISLKNFTCRYNVLEAEAGCNLLSLIREMSNINLGGWEKLSGIPGTIGGAVRGNAGAFGVEIKDVVTKVRAFNANKSDLSEMIREFSNNECDFAYRHSFFKDNRNWIITSVAVRLLKVADRAESKRLIEQTIAGREKRHLQNIQAAGSYFMNPVAPREVQEMFEKDKGMKSREGRVPAGWLIEKSGMKGAKVGGAMASFQHPNYIVNEGHASARDVKELAQKIKDAVRAKFGVDLQ